MPQGRRMSLKLLTTLWSVISPDRRPEREKAREREFIRAANSLKTLKVTPEGGMSIDPEELRDQIIAAREQLQHLVHQPGKPSRPFQPVAENEESQKADPAAEAPVELQDCIEVVTWRRLHSGAAVRYVCLQSTHTGKYAVATASMFSGALETLPTWIDGNANRLVANALQGNELNWYAIVSDAMDAWDVEI